MLASAINEQPDALATESLDSLVSLCKASADSLRLQVLRVLRGDSFGLGFLYLGVSLPRPVAYCL